MTTAESNRANRKTVKWLVGIILGMFVFAFAQVQLYGLFCQVIGVDSLSAREPVGKEYTIDNELKENLSATSARYISMRFDTTVNADLPWSFIPLEKKIRLRPGETQQITYKVKNLTGETLTGQSIPNVLPWQAQPFLQKVECFCYEQQVLQPFEEKEIQVVFSISPKLPDDMNSLVLSYTFLNADKDSAQKYQQLNLDS